MALQLRRGTNKQRLQITPSEGELIFVTDYALVSKTGTTIASNLITFSAAHGLAVGDQVRYIGTTQNGLTNNQVYFVIADGLTTTALKLSTTSGGGAATLTNGTSLTLPFAITPTTAAGTPLGTSVTALWIGDGSTVGGVPGNTQTLDDLIDVVITTPGEGNILYYDGANWVNTSTVATAVANNRLTLQYDNSTNAINAALTLRKNYGATGYSGSNDGVAVKFEVDQDSDATPREFALLGAEWDTSFPMFKLLTSTNDGSTYQTAAVFSTSMATVTGDLTVNGNTIWDSTNTGAIELLGSANVRINGDLTVNGNDIKSSTGATAITLSGNNIVTANDLTVTGNLTVNGTTTTVNSTTLTVDDKNIELASVTSPSDTIADGGGITLRGDSDKTILWQNDNDWWRFNQHVGVDNDLYLNTAQVARDVVVNFATTGSLTTNTLKWNNSTSRFEFNQTLYSANNIAAAGNVAVNRDASDADGILVFYKPTTGTETIRWNKTTGRFELSTDMFAPQATIGNIDIDRTNGTITTNTGNLTLDSTGGTVAVNDNLNVDSGVFYVDAANNRVGVNNPTPNFAMDVNGSAWFNDDVTILDSLNLKGNTIVANGGATAITLDGANVTTYGNLTVANDLTVDTNTLYVKSSTNQVAINTLTPAAGFALTVNGSIYSGDGVVANGDLGTNGNNIYFNYDDSTAGTSNIVVRRGAGVDVTLRWNESTTRWEQTSNGSTFYVLPNQNLDTTDNPTFAGITGGSVRVGVTGDNEIDTSSGGLTIDSAGGTVTVDDDLVVTGGLNVNSGVLFVDPTNNYVGVNDATPNKALDVVGEIRSDTNVLTPKIELNSAATLDAYTSTTTSTSEFTLAETTGDVLKVIIHMSLGSQRHCVEALAMKYGASTAGLTTYAELNTVAGGSPIANFTADVSSGSLRIRATPTSSSSTTFKVVRTQVA